MDSYYVGPSFHHQFVKDKNLKIKTLCLSDTFKQTESKGVHPLCPSKPLSSSSSSSSSSSFCSRSYQIRKMSRKPISLFALSLLLLLLVQPLGSTSSLHNLLQSQGLPAGLFPDTVKSYDLDNLGRLEVYLEWPCLSKFDTRVYYESVVRANLTFGGLSGLEGLSQEELFLWLPVKGITVNDPSSGLILFDIGVAHKQLSLSLFEDPPVCRPQAPGTRKMGSFQAQR